MLYWYRGLMLGEKLKKKPEKHIRKVEQYYRARPKSTILGKKDRLYEHFVGKKIPFKEYFVVTRATNPDNLFDVMGTRQWVLRHYARTDIYVIGLYTAEDEALEAVQTMLAEGYAKDAGYEPRKRFSNDRDFIKFREEQVLPLKELQKDGARKEK